MASPPESSIQVAEVGLQKFTMAVTFDGQRFDCGIYISRAAAMLAGRLFVERKQGERTGRTKRARKTVTP